MSKTASSAFFILCATLATTATAAAGTKPPAAITPATEQQKTQAVEQYAQIRGLSALGAHCNWLTPIDQVAVNAAAEERLAWLAWQHGDLAGARDKAAALVKQSEALDCKTQLGKRQAVQFGGWQMRSSWALRGYGMLPGATHPAWFAGKSSVDTHSKALKTVFDDLLKFNAESVTLSVQMFEQTTPTWLSVRCKAKDHDCPAAITDKGERQYAETMVKLTERYAAALEGVADKAGIPKSAH